MPRDPFQPSNEPATPESTGAVEEAPTPSSPVSPGVAYDHEPDNRPATNPSGNPLPDVPQALNPSDRMMTGGAGTNLDETVQERRVGEESGTKGERARNRMQAENNVDLDAASDSGPRAQGNKYGLSKAAAENFRDTYRSQAEELRRRADTLEGYAEDYQRKIDDNEVLDPENPESIDTLADLKLDQEQDKSRGDMEAALASRPETTPQTAEPGIESTTTDTTQV